MLYANILQSVNLGPVSLGIGGSVTAEVGPQNGLGYNPRCLKRDVNPSVALQYTNITAVTRMPFDSVTEAPCAKTS